MKILISNPGSTSFKCKLFDTTDWSILFQAAVERIGDNEGILSVQHQNAKKVTTHQPIPDYHDAIRITLDAMERQFSIQDVDAVGFKTVLAKNVTGCVELDDSVIRAMEDFKTVSPVHTEIYLTAISVFKDLLPDKKLLGLFETTFHRTIPEAARVYGVPAEYTERLGIKKYGFHGASHWSVSKRIEEKYLKGKTSYKAILCHLGGSSSVCAIRDGESMDTSMGMSPQCGLLNAKRVGDLDPFALLYIMEQENLTVDQARDVLCNRGGVYGISDLSGDFRDIQSAMKAGNTKAKLAFDAFTYSVKRYIGEYLAVLNDADFIVFTAGMGENEPAIRKAILKNMDNLGIKIDDQRNEANPEEGVISSDDSRVKILIIPTNEELVVAQEIGNVLTSHD